MIEVIPCSRKAMPLGIEGGGRVKEHSFGIQTAHILFSQVLRFTVFALK